MDTHTEIVPTETVLQMAVHPKRRTMVQYFVETDERTVDLDGLVEYVIAEESLSPLDRQRVSIELHHTHLPMVSETGILDYDIRERTARYNGSEELERLLDFVANELP